MHVKVGDYVIITCGDYQSSSHYKVISINNKHNTLILEGAAKGYKHVKKGHPKSPQGGRLTIDLPIHVSNVQKV